MSGVALTRTWSRDGAWAYTLCNGGTSHAFVHALNTRTRVARCIDLPWAGDARSAQDGVPLAVTPNRVLTLTGRGGADARPDRHTDVLGRGVARQPAGAPASAGSVASAISRDDLDDVAVRVEDAQLAVGAVAAAEDLADALELALGAELARVRLDLPQRAPDELRDRRRGSGAPVARSITGASRP